MQHMSHVPVREMLAILPLLIATWPCAALQVYIFWVKDWVGRLRGVGERRRFCLAPGILMSFQHVQMYVRQSLCF